MTLLWSADDLVAATSGHMAEPFAALGVSIDSRTVAPGELFVALTDQRDGHAFVADALARGAAGALVSRVPGGMASTAPLLVVDDTLLGLTALGAYARRRFAGSVVAVTGSVGKTTTKEMLRAVLSVAGPTWAAEASHNNQWGVPLTLARLPRDAVYCVVEIGMNHAGEIAPLSRLARPDVCVITTVERAHVGHLGSLCAIADEKAAIVAGLAPGGAIVLPSDSVMLSRLQRAVGGAGQKLFGAGDAATSRLIEARTDADGTEIVAEIDGVRVAFRLPAPGRHMAMNAVAALAAAAALGMDPVQSAQALAAFTPVSGRGARRCIAVRGGEAILLDESYNANAASVRAALAVLALQPATRRVAVLGDMLELGAHGPAEHASLAPDVAAAAHVLFTCGPLMQTLADAVPPPMRGAHAPDSAALAPIVVEAVRPGDALLVKGSLGSRMKLIVDALGTPG